MFVINHLGLRPACLISTHQNCKPFLMSRYTMVTLILFYKTFDAICCTLMAFICRTIKRIRSHESIKKMSIFLRLKVNKYLILYTSQGLISTIIRNMLPFKYKKEKLLKEGSFYFHI